MGCHQGKAASLSQKAVKTDGEEARAAKTPFLLGSQDVVKVHNADAATPGLAEDGRTYVPGARVAAITEIRYSQDACVPKGTLGTVDAVLNTNLWIIWDIPMSVDNAVVLASQVELADKVEVTRKEAVDAEKQDSDVLNPGPTAACDASVEPQQCKEDTGKEIQRVEVEASESERGLHPSENGMSLSQKTTQEQDDSALKNKPDAATIQKLEKIATKSKTDSPTEKDEKPARKEKNFCCC